MRFEIRCTRCRKTEWMDDEDLQKASQFGCAFSRCCNAVATVESVETTQGKTVPRRRVLVNFRGTKR